MAFLNVRKCVSKLQFEQEKEPKRHFLIIPMDGWNLGLADDFAETFLEFDLFSEAQDVALHWDAWINGERI